MSKPELTVNDFMVAFTYHANKLGYECAEELLRYAQVITRHIQRIPGYRYTYYWHLLHAAFGDDDNPSAFEYRGRLYAAMCTRTRRGRKAQERFCYLKTLMKGVLDYDHQTHDSSHHVVKTFARHHPSIFKKDSLFWISIKKPEYPADSALMRILDAEPIHSLPFGGFVGDHQRSIQDGDYPKTRLFRVSEHHIEYNAGLRSIFPEMVASYKLRSYAKWAFLRCGQRGSQDETTPPATVRQDGSSESVGSDSEGSDTEDSVHASDGDDDQSRYDFTYFHEFNEWVPDTYIAEYRLYRLRQRRLSRLLRPLILAYRQHLYEAPDGALYRKVAATTLIGKGTVFM